MVHDFAANYCVALCCAVVMDSHIYQPLYTLFVCDCTVSLALITSMGCVRTVANTPANAPAPILQTALRLLDLPSRGKCYKRMIQYLIGASLSEPHTSVTALRTRVYVGLSMDRPHTVNFK